MRFWDTSALVPLLVEEDATGAVRAYQTSDPVIIVAWTTPVEIASAIARAEHDQLLTEVEAVGAFERLDELAGAWREVEPSDDLREVARRLLRTHRLRAVDALQLAAATLAAERRPASLPLVTLDERLVTAATREGFIVHMPGKDEPSEEPEVEGPGTPDDG